MNPKAPKFKVDDRVRITQCKDIFSKGLFINFQTENQSREILPIDTVLKTNLWTNKIKYFNGKKITAIFYEKELLLSKL